MVESNTIHNADALEILPQIPDAIFNLILTDPPYNVSSDTKITRSGGKFGEAKDIDMNFGDWDWESIKPSDYIDDFARILKPNGVLIMFYDRLLLGPIGLYLENKYDFQVRHFGTWVKSNPAPQARKVKWMIGTENFLVATKNQGAGHHFNYELGQSPDYYECSVSFKPRYHPTQKPLRLIKWIMQYWSFEGDLVLDPFAGSGTTCVAARDLNRKYIGVEISEQYCEIARKRLAQQRLNI